MAVHAGESTASRDHVAEQAPAVRGRRFLEYLGAPPSVTAYQHGVLWVVGLFLNATAIALFLPETASQELEEISPEREA
jgi:hypothetical protein